MKLVKENEYKENYQFFRQFEIFRDKYNDLQKVLFVYLSYILEYYSKTTLSPMKLEYPRITRTLLKKLIDYEILKPWKFIGTLNGFKSEKIGKEMKKAFENETNSITDPLKKASEEKMIEKFKEKAEEKAKKRDEFKDKNPYLIKNKQEFKKRFKNWAKDEGNLKDIEDIESLEIWVTSKFKEEIEWWHFTADDLEKIVDCIYARNEVPNFFRHFQDDFQERYLELKECIRGLPSAPDLPADSDVKEYKVSLGNLSKESDSSKKSQQESFKLDLDFKEKP